MFDRQETDDERLTALRGLARFPDQDVAGLLVKVMEDEKDVALKDRAKLSLIAITGKTLPADPAAWRAYLQSHPPTQVARDGNPLMKIIHPLGN